jgi:hypothetical protein
VAEDPRLARDGLDDVVAVEVLEGLEVVKRAARAGGPAQVDEKPRRGATELMALSAPAGSA